MNIKLKKTPSTPYKEWKVEYHDGLTSFDPKSLSLHLEPEQEKGYINGNTLFERLKGKGLNSNVLDYLYEHQELIPEEWKGKYVYFWGTIYRRSDGSLYVRSLSWHDDRWVWYYSWLDDVWRSYRPAAASASPLTSDTELSSTQSLDLAIAKVKEAGYQVSKIL